MVMSLVSKFSRVKIDHSKTLLQGADAEAVNEIETNFAAAFAFHETHIEFYNINMEYANNPFLSIHEEVELIQKEVAKLTISRVEKIVRHFASKYKISLDENKIKEMVLPENDYHVREKEKEKKIPALTRIQKFKFPVSKILDQIQGKLGGLSLDEMSLKETKHNFWNSYARAYHRDYKSQTITPVAELIKNRIEFERGPYINSDYGGTYSFHHNSNVHHLAAALSYIETGSSEIIPEFTYMKPWEKIPDAFSEKEFALTKIKAIRFYKNRKMVVKFADAATAEMFFREWCLNGNTTGDN